MVILMLPAIAKLLFILQRTCKLPNAGIHLLAEGWYQENEVDLVNRESAGFPGINPGADDIPGHLCL